MYRANGNPGYVDSDAPRAHLHGRRSRTAPPRRPRPKQLTDGEFDERGIEWAPDGSTIYFTSTRVRGAVLRRPSDAELFACRRAGGAIAKVASIDGTIGNVSPSPDGKRIAFVGTLRGNADPLLQPARPLCVTDADAGQHAEEPDAGVRLRHQRRHRRRSGGAARRQNRKPIVWSHDGASLIVVSAEKGSSNSSACRSPPARSSRSPTARTTSSPSARRRTRSTIAATLSTQTNIGDIAIDSDRRAAVAQRATAITHVNDELFKDIQQSEPEEIWYKSFDGKNIQGWILKPPDFDASKKYPLILEIHGGPHAAYGNVYTHEFQWMAAKGYVVLFTNPRGSTSYGQDFGNIIQYHYPGDDYKDLMAGVDEVVKKGYVDREPPRRHRRQRRRTADELDDHADAALQGGGRRSATSPTGTASGSPPTSRCSTPTWFRKAPWEDPQDFAARSPITHVANVTTPLMLVYGDADYRTPPADGGEMMFRALKYRKIPTVMVRFPRETHELSRSGEPWHRVERLQHIVGWMDQWLHGEEERRVRDPVAAGGRNGGAGSAPHPAHHATCRRISPCYSLPSRDAISIARPPRPTRPMGRLLGGDAECDYRCGRAPSAPPPCHCSWCASPDARQRRAPTPWLTMRCRRTRSSV